jgi:glucose/arabinose dehydrogenase
MSSVGVTEEPADQERNDYPISWIRKYEGGRVFVTKLGHFPEVWQNPAYITHVLQGLRIAAGRLEADFGGRRVKEVLSPDVWPDDIAVDERGNVWIAELRGKIHHYDAATKQTRLLAEIKTTDPTGIEHGIYGIEVDPNFYRGEPYVYIFYAEPETFVNTLYRYEYRNDAIDFSTEAVILRVPTEPQCCHQAGDLEWGPDGTLFVSTGDTGYSGTKPEWEISQERIKAFAQQHDLKDIHWSRLVDSENTSQNLSDLRGKVLRINKDGSIPKDNPFYGQPGIRWEIFAYGLRNPYRVKWDEPSKALYIGVVGPDAVYDYDEYNVAKGGENFGWPRSIGRLFYNEWTPDMIPNFTPPIWEYRYDQGGARSATFGPIYRHMGPGAFPEAFQNKAFVFDWSRRWIKYGDMIEGTYATDDERMVKNTSLNYQTRTLRLTNVKLFDQLTLSTPITMEMGPDGCLYVAEYDGFWDPGPNAQVSRYCWVEE